MRIKLADSTTQRRSRLRRRRPPPPARGARRGCSAAGAQRRLRPRTSTSTRSAPRSTTTAISSSWPTTSSRFRSAEVLSARLTRSRSSRTSATPSTVASAYQLDDYFGTHGIGHVRMATESDVDIANAHPYWAYPFSDVAVVHNGQLTNYHQWRRRLESHGHRFASMCDSEIIAVYLADRMAEGESLEDAMHRSLEDLDGVFTYICVSEDALGSRQGRARRQAAGPLRGRRHGRAGIRGDGDPGRDRPRN